MQHVKKSWLSVFAYGLLGIDILYFVVYFLFEQLQVSQATKDTWGITPVILGMAAFHGLYILIVFPFLRKKFEWLATVISISLQAVLIASVIDTSGNTNLVYRFSYVALVFFMGLGGPFPPTAAVILTWLIMTFTYTGVTSGTQASLLYNFVINILVTLAALSGWVIFKRFYVKVKDAETIALSKMLEQEQFKSNVMLESITDGVMIINTRGTVQVLNKSAADMVGWSQEEALKLDYRSLLKISNQDKQQKGEDSDDVITRSLQSRQPAQRICLLQTKNDRRVFVDIVASPIFESEGAEKSAEKLLVGIIAVLRNVDEQKRQEQERSDFISTASHEMRTPVASIQGYLDLTLTPSIWEDTEKVRSYIEKARTETQHLGKLFQDLLSVSQSEDKQLSNNPELIEINDFLDKAISSELHMAEEKGLKVVQEFKNPRHTPRPQMQISADPQRLKEVIQNLFENAIKYTTEGSIIIRTSVAGDTVRIAISDTGMGIADEDIPHLFQKFYRTDNSATREIGGTGLGLYICKQIIEIMNGKIWVESTAGAGSTFYVELPRVQGD